MVQGEEERAQLDQDCSLEDSRVPRPVPALPETSRRLHHSSVSTRERGARVSGTATSAQTIPRGLHSSP